MKDPVERIIEIRNDMLDQIQQIINKQRKELNGVVNVIKMNMPKYQEGDILLAFNEGYNFGNTSVKPRKYFPVVCEGIKSIEDNHDKLLDFSYQKKINSEDLHMRFSVGTSDVSSIFSESKIGEIHYFVQTIYKTSGNISSSKNGYNHIASGKILKKLGTLNDYDTPEKRIELCKKINTLNNTTTRDDVESFMNL